MLRLEEDKSNSDEVHSQLSRSTSQTLSGLKSQLAELARQAKFFEDEYITWKRIAEERDLKLRELEEENDDLKSHKAPEDSTVTDPSRDNDWKVVRDELTRQASYLRTLESSNSRMSVELIQLRLRNESIEALKEQKRDLAHKLDREISTADTLRQSVAKLEVEVEAARKEKEEWYATSMILTRPVLIFISQDIKGKPIWSTHPCICRSQSHQPATRTWACNGGVRSPQSCSTAEGTGGA